MRRVLSRISLRCFAAPIVGCSPPVVAGVNLLGTIRHTSTAGSPAGPSGTGGQGSSGVPVGGQLRGCVRVDTSNFKKEILESKIPTLLYFHAGSHEVVVRHTALMCKNVTLTNAGHGTDDVVKLALVDVEREPMLAQQFQVTPQEFPLVYFVLDGQVMDKLPGVVPEEHIIEAIAAFLKVSNDQKAKNTATESEKQEKKLDPADEEDESIVGLLRTANKQVGVGKYAEADALFKHIHATAEAEVVGLKQKMGVAKKKLTPEVQEKLKKDDSYAAIPQSLAGLALCALYRGEVDAAAALAMKVRNTHEWAIRDVREVADAVARAELVKVSGFVPGLDSFETLRNRRAEVTDDAAAVYRKNIKIAVAHYFEGHPELAVDDLLKVIRNEPRVMAELKEAGVTQRLGTPGVTAKNATPARQAIFLVFEGLGNKHRAVGDARKKMAAFI